MKVFVRSKLERFNVRRSMHSNVLSDVKVYGSDGEEVTTATVTIGSIAETLTSASNRNEYYIYCNNLSVGGFYELVTGSGKSVIIYVLGVKNDTVEISSPLPFDVDTGTVYSLEDEVSLTIPNTYTEKAIQLEYIYSDESQIIDEALVVNRKLSNILTDEDLYLRWGRLRGSAPIESGGSFTHTIEEALNILRLNFWQQGYVLDNIRTSSMLRELMFAQVAVLLADMGFDPTGSGDMIEFRREMIKKLSQETQNLINSSNLWLDDNEDNTENDAERGTLGMALKWD